MKRQVNDDLFWSKNFNENINCVLILVYFMFISIEYSMDEQNR